MIKRLLLLSAVTAFLASCNSDSSEQANTTSPSDALNTTESSVATQLDTANGGTSTIAATTTTNQDGTVAQQTAAAGQQNVTIAPLPPAPTKEVKGGKDANVKLNPAHGQPGHDCAIPVGAPLNGSAAAPAQVSVSPSNIQPMNPVAAPTTVAPAPGQASGKLNPAHGEPGHDCAIPVGAPLKS